MGRKTSWPQTAKGQQGPPKLSFSLQPMRSPPTFPSLSPSVPQPSRVPPAPHRWRSPPAAPPAREARPQIPPKRCGLSLATGARPLGRKLASLGRAPGDGALGPRASPGRPAGRRETRHRPLPTHTHSHSHSHSPPCTRALGHGPLRAGGSAACGKGCGAA